MLFQAIFWFMLKYINLNIKSLSFFHPHHKPDYSHTSWLVCAGRVFVSVAPSECTIWDFLHVTQNKQIGIVWPQIFQQTHVRRRDVILSLVTS